MTTTQIDYISKTLSIEHQSVKNTILLLEEGGTVPFIARYRKEKTGSLDEVQIEDIKDLHQKFNDADKRRETVIKSIEEQGKMTPALLDALKKALFIAEIEDLYLPYKQKRKTRGMIAIEKGLEPLAKYIYAQTSRNIENEASKYLNASVKNIDDALSGARDIMAEWINENIEVRNLIRIQFERDAIITSTVKKGKSTLGEKFKDYFEFGEALSKIPSHRLLAIRRGENEGILGVDISPIEEKCIIVLERLLLKGLPEAKEQVALALTDAYKRLIKPSIETEFDNSSKEKADIEAIRIFRENLKQLLLSAPLGQKTVMGIDPGIRTGCKVVILGKQGGLIADGVIYPDLKKDEAKKSVLTWVEKHKIEAIAIGNGTAGRETESFIRDLGLSNIEIFSVSEQGASIYSASAVAREEFPNKDVTVRGAISIGRRLMDPLSELVKIDPKSIGVGQYQHDVDQKLLKQSLDATVESCVNAVGVELNTASKHLLAYVSGLGPTLAQNIVDYRTQNGPFQTRSALKKVPRLGEKAFEQSAGFLRIANGKHPLDNSGVHPEVYGIVEKMAEEHNLKIDSLIGNEAKVKSIDLKKYMTNTVGMPTLMDIAKELIKPSRDPRDKIEVFAFSEHVRKIDDLREGMILPGIVTNITAFGCFVDIGVKQDGLVHISHLANKYVSDPSTVVSLQQKVRVKVMEIDTSRKRIALSMKF